MSCRAWTQVKQDLLLLDCPLANATDCDRWPQSVLEWLGHQLDLSPQQLKGFTAPLLVPASKTPISQEASIRLLIRMIKCRRNAQPPQLLDRVGQENKRCLNYMLDYVFDPACGAEELSRPSTARLVNLPAFMQSKTMLNPSQVANFKGNILPKILAVIREEIEGISAQIDSRHQDDLGASPASRKETHSLEACVSECLQRLEDLHSMYNRSFGAWVDKSSSLCEPDFRLEEHVTKLFDLVNSIQSQFSDLHLTRQAAIHITNNIKELDSICKVASQPETTN